jgi:hypothetical protein
MTDDETFVGFLGAAKKASEELSKESGDNLVASYVYGSLARGDYRESSDVDLHIVLRDYAQAESITHTKWVGSIPVGVSPHPLSFYQTTPEWILEHVDAAAHWEGLWELAKIIILHDPRNVVSTFQNKIIPILNNKALLKTRARLSFGTVKTEAAKVRKETGEDAIIQAICHMYALGGGGDAYSGAAVHVLKTVVRFSGLPLTTQRIWLRFVEACSKLDKPELKSLMEDCYGVSQLSQSSLQEIADESCSLIDLAIEGPLVSTEATCDLKRFKMAVTEHLEMGETGALCVYTLGNFSANYLGLNMEGRQNQIGKKLEELIYRTSGVRSPEDLEERMKPLQKAMDMIQKELLEN